MKPWGKFLTVVRGRSKNEALRPVEGASQGLRMLYLQEEGEEMDGEGDAKWEDLSKIDSLAGGGG